MDRRDGVEGYCGAAGVTEAGRVAPDWDAWVDALERTDERTLRRWDADVWEAERLISEMRERDAVLAGEGSFAAPARDWEKGAARKGAAAAPASPAPASQAPAKEFSPAITDVPSTPATPKRRTRASRATATATARAKQAIPAATAAFSPVITASCAERPAREKDVWSVRNSGVATSASPTSPAASPATPAKEFSPASPADAPATPAASVSPSSPADASSSPASPSLLEAPVSFSSPAAPATSPEEGSPAAWREQWRRLRADVRAALEAGDGERLRCLKLASETLRIAQECERRLGEDAPAPLTVNVDFSDMTPERVSELGVAMMKARP